MHKLSLFILCTFFAFSSYSEEEILSSEVIASNADSKKSCPSKECGYCNDPISHLQLGGSYRYAHVKPTGLATLTGHLGGLNASYEYQRAHLIYEALTFAWRQGSTHGSGNKRTICDIDTQGRIGYTVGKGRECWILSLFSGLGYRHLGETSTIDGNSIGYDYNDLYVPIGFFLNGAVGKCLYMGLHFQWRPQVYPTVEISSLKGARFDTNYMFGNVLAELPISFILSRKHNISLILKPFFEFWQDGSTFATSAAGIPLGVSKVTYLFAGADLNFSWSF